ncbi:hypothetical protein VTN02DRAFT_6749 [Thermoascus thermophilus]
MAQQGPSLSAVLADPETILSVGNCRPAPVQSSPCARASQHADWPRPAHRRAPPSPHRQRLSPTQYSGRSPRPLLGLPSFHTTVSLGIPKRPLDPVPSENARPPKCRLRTARGIQPFSTRPGQQARRTHRSLEDAHATVPTPTTDPALESSSVTILDPDPRNK